MNASKLLVKDLRDILTREGYGDIASDRSIRKPQLVAYVEDLVEHRHAEALEINVRRDEMAAWRASFEVEAPAMGVEQDAHVPVAGVPGTSLGEMREAFRPAPAVAPQRRAERPLTFPVAEVVKGSRVWRNSETGVEIIKGARFAEVGLYYVCHPTRDQSGRAVGFVAISLRQARAYALLLATHMRTKIAEAHTAACLEDSDREGARLLAEGEAIREANQREQIEAWLMRHDVTELTAENILAARDVDHAEAIIEDARRAERLCDCDGEHAPVPGGHSVACRRRESLDLYGIPTLDEQHTEAIAEDERRRVATLPSHAEWMAEDNRRRAEIDDRGMHMGPGHVAPATIAKAHAEALTENARRSERETVYCENNAHGAPGTPHFDAADCAYPHYTDTRTRSRLNAEATDPRQWATSGTEYPHRGGN